MKRAPSALLCLTLVLCTAVVAFAAQEPPLRIIQDEERMVFHGKDLFAYTSGELFDLVHALGLYDPEKIGYIGYYGENPEELTPGLALDFDGFFAMTQSDDPNALENRDALIALPLEETTYRVYYVGIVKPGIAGPFGLEVGMPVGTLHQLLPELTASPGACQDVKSEETLIMQYQSDTDGETAVYGLRIHCFEGKVGTCYIMLE